MPADLDRQFGRYNLPDHGNLLSNLFRWAAKDNIPLIVEGPGLIDFYIYHQPGRIIMHMVNLTNSGTWRQPVDELISVGPMKVRLKLSSDVTGKDLSLLVSKRKLSTEVYEGWSSFEIPSILDHEVVVVT